MRWMWIDRIVALERGVRCVAIKNISLAEEHLHDHFPSSPHRRAIPVMPGPLIIEGMAQTAGILVGHARHFREKVILAKIGKAQLPFDAHPGCTLRYTAALDRIDDAGASATGTVELLDPVTSSVSGGGVVELMFSHIDKNMQGLAFPDHNFVFTDQFMNLLRDSGFAQ